VATFYIGAKVALTATIAVPLAAGLPSPFTPSMIVLLELFMDPRLVGRLHRRADLLVGDATRTAQPGRPLPRAANGLGNRPVSASPGLGTTRRHRPQRPMNTGLPGPLGTGLDKPD
jgi:hypothetical protein